MRDALALVAKRLERDLRSRFPNIAVRFVKGSDRGWACRVEDGLTCWGEAGTWVEDGNDLPPDDLEHVLVDITSNVADNLWPDELTDPWPPCPRHAGHPLHPQLKNRRAMWTCLHDGSVAIPIGALSR